MEFLNRNAPAIQAISAIATVVIAVGALLGVKYQVDSTDAIQRQQSARDIYREFLNLSISNPDLAQPDVCALEKSPRAAAYDAYVEYLLYTSEQLLAVDASFQPTLEQTLLPHAKAVCVIENDGSYSPDVVNLLSVFKTKHCANVTPCG